MSAQKYSLIISVVNRGCADEVMHAARKAGAFGGTIITARGTGAHEQKKFFGTVIEPEKDMVLILTEQALRNGIMEAITRDTGLSKEGVGICFALPVDNVVGISRFEG